MSCVLHITGDKVDVDALIDLAPVAPATSFKKGEPRSPRPNARRNSTSGIAIVVSDADFDDFDRQKKDAIEFLQRHKSRLHDLLATVGIQHRSIDFGIEMRNVIAQTDSFDPEVVMAAADLRLGITLSQYPIAVKNKRIRQYRRNLRKRA